MKKQYIMFMLMCMISQGSVAGEFVEPGEGKERNERSGEIGERGNQFGPSEAEKSGEGSGQQEHRSSIDGSEPSVSDKSSSSSAGGLDLDGDQPSTSDTVSSVKSQMSSLSAIANTSFFENFGFESDGDDYQKRNLIKKYREYSKSLHPDKFNEATAQTPAMRKMVAKFGVHVPEGKTVTSDDVAAAFKNMTAQYNTLKNPEKRSGYKNFEGYKSVQEKVNRLQRAVDALPADVSNAKSLQELQRLIDTVSLKLASDPEQIADITKSLDVALEEAQEAGKTGFSAYRSSRSGRVDATKAQAEFDNQREHIADGLSRIADMLKSINAEIDGSDEMTEDERENLVTVRNRYKEIEQMYKKALQDVNELESRLQTNPDSVTVEDVKSMIQSLQSTSAQMDRSSLYEGSMDLDRSTFTKIIDWFKDFINYHFKDGSSSDSSSQSAPSSLSSSDFGG